MAGWDASRCIVEINLILFALLSSPRDERVDPGHPPRRRPPDSDDDGERERERERTTVRQVAWGSRMRDLDLWSSPPTRGFQRIIDLTRDGYSHSCSESLCGARFSRPQEGISTLGKAFPLKKNRRIHWRGEKTGGQSRARGRAQWGRHATRPFATTSESPTIAAALSPRRRPRCLLLDIEAAPEQQP